MLRIRTFVSSKSQHFQDLVTSLETGNLFFPGGPQAIHRLFQLQALADALRVNQTVKSVNLHWNKIGDEGFKAPQWVRAKEELFSHLSADYSSKSGFLGADFALNPPSRKVQPLSWGHEQ